jgi:hypothetical protein
MFVRFSQFCVLAMVCSFACYLNAADSDNSSTRDNERSTTADKSKSDKSDTDKTDKISDRKSTSADSNTREEKAEVTETVAATEHKKGNVFTRFWVHTIGGSIGDGLKGKKSNDTSSESDKDKEKNQNDK